MTPERAVHAIAVGAAVGALLTAATACDVFTYQEHIADEAGMVDLLQRWVDDQYPHVRVLPDESQCDLLPLDRGTGEKKYIVKTCTLAMRSRTSATIKVPIWVAANPDGFALFHSQTPDFDPTDDNAWDDVQAQVDAKVDAENK